MLTEAAKEVANPDETLPRIMKIIKDVKPTLHEAEAKDEALIKLIRGKTMCAARKLHTIMNPARAKAI